MEGKVAESNSTTRTEDPSPAVPGPYTSTACADNSVSSEDRTSEPKRVKLSTPENTDREN